MKRMTIALALGAALIIPANIHAQAVEAPVESELRSMLVTEEVRSDRDVVLDFLDDEAVARAAAVEGIDLAEVESRVRTMDDAATSDLADRVRELQDGMVGGDTFVIGSTTLIIILLILILLTD